MLPFRVGQIARVTQLVTVVERAVFGGPHAGSRGCSPTGTHRGVEPVKQISPPPITDSNDSQSLRTDTKEVSSAPAYSVDDIKHWIQDIANIENANLKMLEQHNLTARLLCYEDIVGDRSTALS